MSCLVNCLTVLNNNLCTVQTNFDGIELVDLRCHWLLETLDSLGLTFMVLVLKDLKRTLCAVDESGVISR